MRTLAFDTTTNFCSVALFDDKKAEALYCENLLFGQSEKLIVKINEILCSNRLSVRDLDLVAVCNGPGSFTGVRSSIAVARSFGLVNKNLALCGIKAFDVYAHHLKESQRSQCNAVLVETKRDDYYVAYYDSCLQQIKTPKTAHFDEIINDLNDKNVTLTGDGVERFLSKPNRLHINDVVYCEKPPVEVLGTLAQMHYQSKNLDFPTPFYLKAADVCVK